VVTADDIESNVFVYSLGEPPYNGGAFYGNADTHFQVTSTGTGEIWTQTGMEMPITSQT